MMKPHRNQKHLKLTGVLVLIALLAGCRNLGTGVILWPPEESRWEPGDLVAVKDDSFLRKTYIVNLPGQRRLKEEIDQWRIKLFKREKEAVNWAASMGEWKDVYAECLYQGLPMREEASNTSERIYRFREGDVMKVLSRGDGPVQVGNLEGYWYKVLSHGGVTGYVFDYYLLVSRVENGNKEILNARSTDDPVLDGILSAPWRPRYFETMMQENQVDLNRFRSDYGLFPDIENKTLYLKLADVTLKETWTDIVPSGRNRYDFLGTSFRITFNSAAFISVQYKADGNEHFEGFIRLAENIDDIVARESERRSGVLTTLLEKGPVYDSRAYGELKIEEDGSFTWSGKSALIARNLLSSTAGNRGKLEFDVFPSPSISSFHEGVLTFRFESGQRLYFLFSFEDGGLRMLYVPPSAVADRQVNSDKFIDPVRLFFLPIGVSSGS